MHPKTLLPAAMVVCSLFIATQKISAQQATETKPVNLTPAEMRADITPPNYTFRILQILGNTPGYVILNNTKPVYLFKGIAITETGKTNLAALTKQPDVEKAAKLSIEKIKAGQNPALSNDELKQLIDSKSAPNTN